MKREDLKVLELADEVIDQIMKLHGKDVEAHKVQLTEAEKQVTSLQGQLDEANKTIEGFKELDVDGIKAAANEWKTKAEQAKAEATAEIEKLKFDHALEGALTEARAKNPKAVKALLNFENLKLAEGGKVKLVKMNIDDHPSIAGQLGIQSIPAVVVFHNGQPVDGFVGAVPESQIDALIGRLAGPAGDPLCPRQRRSAGTALRAARPGGRRIADRDLCLRQQPVSHHAGAGPCTRSPGGTARAEALACGKWPPCPDGGIGV